MQHPPSSPQQQPMSRKSIVWTFPKWRSSSINSCSLYLNLSTQRSIYAETYLHSCWTFSPTTFSIHTNQSLFNLSFYKYAAWMSRSELKNAAEAHLPTTTTAKTTTMTTLIYKCPLMTKMVTMRMRPCIINLPQCWSISWWTIKREKIDRLQRATWRPLSAEPLLWAVTLSAKLWRLCCDLPKSTFPSSMSSPKACSLPVTGTPSFILCVKRHFISCAFGARKPLPAISNKKCCCKKGKLMTLSLVSSTSPLNGGPRFASIDSNLSVFVWTA
mmetsp:Transcript_22190/g.48133  ORF Transcript_22190/g.48133 Transcript_22190/m.48133 type:complete len:272 (+) Transcript_22190:355-1170(+)